MATINFYLKDPDCLKPTPIILFFSYEGERLKLYASQSIHPKFWNAKKQLVRESYPDYNYINTILADKGKLILHCYQQAKLEKVAMTKEYLKAQFDKGDKIAPKTSFFEFMKELIDRGSKNGVTLTKGTLAGYKTTVKHLRTFNPHIDFNDFDLVFYDNFTHYLTSTLNHSPNGVGSNIKNIKSFLASAAERGLHNNMEFKHKRFKRIKETTEAIYLTEAELAKFYALDLSKNKRLDKVRDLFLVGCWTGLRFSDFSRLRPENFNNGIIELKTLKTQTVVSIPIHWMVAEILAKYKGILPTVISNQQMNEYLKELGQLAELNTMERKTKFEQGKKEDVYLPKHALLSSHTARRSFATNMYMRGDIPTYNIMLITGHKTEQAFLLYIRMKARENAEKLKSHAFFNKPVIEQAKTLA